MKTGRFLLGSISFALVFIFSCDSGGGSGGGDSYPKDVWCVYGLVPLSDCTALPIPNAETESQYKTNCETTNGTFFTSQPTECSGQGGGGGSSSSVVGGSSSSGGGVSSPSGDGYPKDLWCIFEISEEDCEPYDIIDAEDEADLKEFCEENGGMFSASKPSICGSLGGVSSSSARGVSSSGGGGSYPKDLWCMFDIFDEEDCEPYDIIDAEDEADFKGFCEYYGGMFFTSKPAVCNNLGGNSSSSAGISSSSLNPNLIWNLNEHGGEVLTGGGWFDYDDSENGGQSGTDFSCDESSCRWKDAGGRVIFNLWPYIASYYDDYNQMDVYYRHAFAGVGFSWLANGKAAPEVWGSHAGLCVEYSLPSSLINFYIEINSSSTHGDDVYRITLPARAVVGKAYFAFSSFTQEGWGKVITLSQAKNASTGINFKGDRRSSVAFSPSDTEFFQGSVNLTLKSISWGSCN